MDPLLLLGEGAQRSGHSDVAVLMVGVCSSLDLGKRLRSPLTVDGCEESNVPPAKGESVQEETGSLEGVTMTHGEGVTMTHGEGSL